MKNQDLHSSSDEQIRDLLSKMKVGYDKSSWSTLENKLDSISNMQETDRLFKESLSSFQANYIPSSWSLLQYKMDYLIYNRRHLIGLKVTELAILLLLFWFWWGPVGHKPNLDRADLTEAITQKANPIDEVNLFIKHSAVPDEESINQQTSNASMPGEISHPQNSGVEHVKDSPLNNLTTLTNLTSPSEGAKIAFSTETTFPSNSVSDILPVKLQLNSISYHITNLLENKNFGVRPTDPDKLDNTMLNAAFLHKDNSKQLKTRTKNPFQYWISGAISYDKDLIRTPFPSQQSVNHLGRIERSFHGELNLFISNGMLEFQTGVGFWSKDYRSVYEGNNDAMVISIPANLRLKLSQRGFMRGYLMGGISTNFVAYANYNETSYFKELESNTIIVNNFQARPSTIFSSSGYDHGILQGESIKGNQYFTVNMGIGIDIPINPSISLYLEQVYFHHLDGGIGPAFDKFSTSSTIIGLRYLLNK